MDIKNLKFMAATILMLLLASSIAQALSAASASIATGGKENEREKAEAIVNVASKAGELLVELNRTIQTNSTIMDMIIKDSGLLSDFEGNISLIEEGLALLEEAKEDLNNGNYADAMNEAMEAMGKFKEAWVGIHQILCEVGVTEAEGKPEVQAQGLLVAMERGLERINRIKSAALSGSGADEIEKLLKNATDLLNEIPSLLETGNVSDAAHRLAEANKLIAEAHRMLKAMAEAELAERMERFRVRVMERLEAMVGELNESEINEILSEMGFRKMSEFKQALNNLINEAKENVGVRLGKLKDFNEKIRGFARRFAAKTVPPEARDENPALEVSVEKQTFRNQVTLKVTVKNTGNCDIEFPNAALGLVIEKNVDGGWTPYYQVISAQVITALKPGESKEITVRITKPDAGEYRAVVNGWSKITLKTATASAEFSIP